ncbi:MAG: hypothetical protein QXT40_01395 [Candidatus Micrarchaeia archaeon]
MAGENYMPLLLVGIVALIAVIGVIGLLILNGATANTATLASIAAAGADRPVCRCFAGCMLPGGHVLCAEGYCGSNIPNEALCKIGEHVPGAQCWNVKCAAEPAPSK